MVVCAESLLSAFMERCYVEVTLIWFCFLAVEIMKCALNLL